MPSAFLLGPPDDLVWPKASSKTSRALVSFAQRSLFEARGELVPAAIEGTDEAKAIGHWLELVAGMLPGNPHVVARSLRDPAVSIPARLLLRGDADVEIARAFVGSALLWLALEGVLTAPITLPFTSHALALGHAAEVHTATFGPGMAHDRIVPVEGRLLALDEGPWSARGRARVSCAHDDASIRSLREALAWMTQNARAERDDLDRVASGFVLGARERWDLPLGVIFVPARARVAELVAAILAELAVEKLALLGLGDEVASPLAPLRALCADATSRRADVAELRGRLERVIRESQRTELGEGIVRELRARLGI